MNRQKQNNKMKLVILFAVPVVVYTVLDMLIGQTFQYIFLAPIIPLVDSAYHSTDGLDLIFRGISFAFLLCIWSFPVFLFQKTKNLYVKILSCLLGTTVATWYALMSCLSLFLWEDRVRSWAKQVTNSSFVPSLVVLGILGGILFFYISFGFCFCKVLKSKEKIATKTDSNCSCQAIVGVVVKSS